MDEQDSNCGIWQPIEDESSGQIYWYNPTTGDTTWELPAGAVTISATDETVHEIEWPWTKHMDDDTQRPYWYNSMTGDSTWINPEWIKAIDDDSGQPYWHSARTGISTWEQPEDFIETEVYEENVAINELESQNGNETFIQNYSTTETQQQSNHTNTSARAIGNRNSPIQRQTGKIDNLVTSNRNSPIQRQTGKIVQIDFSSDESEEEDEPPARTRPTQSRPTQTKPTNDFHSKLRAKFVSTVLSYSTMSAKIRLLWDISPQEWLQITDCFVLEEYKPGDIVFEQGTRLSKLIVIANGQFIRRGSDENQQEEIVSVNEGEVLCDDALFGDDCATATFTLQSGNIRPNAEYQKNYAFVLDSTHLIQQQGQCWLLRRRERLFRSQPTLASMFVRLVPFFTGLHVARCEHIAKQFRVLVARKNQTIIVEGISGDALYILAHGTVSINVRGHRLTTVKPGDFFGEISLIQGVPATAAVVAEEESLLLALHKHEFLQLVKGTPGLKNALQTHITTRTANSMKAIHTTEFSVLNDKQMFALVQGSDFKHIPPHTVVSPSNMLDPHCFVVMSGFLLVTNQNELGREETQQFGSGSCVAVETLAHIRPSRRSYRIETGVSSAMIIMLSRESIRRAFSYEDSLVAAFELHILQSEASFQSLVRHSASCEQFLQNMASTVQNFPIATLPIDIKFLVDSAKLLDLLWSCSFTSQLQRRQYIERVVAKIYASQANDEILTALDTFVRTHLNSSGATTGSARLSSRELTNLRDQITSFVVAADATLSKSLKKEVTTQIAASSTTLEINMFEEAMNAVAEACGLMAWFVEFRQTPVMRHLCRQAGRLLNGENTTGELTNSKIEKQPSSTTEIRRGHSPRFEVWRATKLGQWQSKYLRFNMDTAELLVYETNGDLVLSVRLSEIRFIERVSKSKEGAQVVLRLAVRDGKTESEVLYKFTDEEQRENFCLLAHLLEQDLVFREDVFQEDTHTGKTSFEVQMAARGHTVRRILTIDQSSKMLLRHREFNDYSTCIELPIYPHVTEISRSFSDSRKLHLVTAKQSSMSAMANTKKASAFEKLVLQEEQKDSMDVSFPTESLREHFVGLIQMLTNQLDVSVVRSFGLDPAGYKQQRLQIWCGTLNCGDTRPLYSTKAMAQWILPRQYDIYAVALQECSHRDEWAKAIIDTLNNPLVSKSKTSNPSTNQSSNPSSNQPMNQPMNYMEIASVSLWSIHLIIFAKPYIARHIANICSDTKATGVANVLGNKGGVGIGFIYRDNTSFAFVSSHLAARPHRVEDRANDYMDICRNLKLRTYMYPRADGFDGSSIQFLHHFDHVFWMGDLNYRTDLGKMNTLEEFNQVVKFATGKRYDQILRGDQLMKERINRGIFAEFQEGKINFPPTYRLIKEEKFSYSNKKNQNPSYTDRILYRPRTGNNAENRQLFLDATFDMLKSDHRPVYSVYDIQCNQPYFHAPHATTLGSRGHVTCSFSYCGLLNAIYDEDVLVAINAGVEVASSCNQNGTKNLNIGRPRRTGLFSQLLTPGEEIFMTFSAPFLTDIATTALASSNSSKSSIKRTNANILVEWDTDALPDLQSLVADGNWLAQQYIVVCVTTQRNRVLGFAQIPLQKAYDYDSFNHTELGNITLTEVIANSFLYEAFYAHLRREHAEENLAFYTAVDTYKLQGAQATDKDDIANLYSHAKKIHTQFTDKNAIQLVNLPSRISQAIRTNLQEFQQFIEQMYDESVQESVVSLANQQKMTFVQLFTDAQGEIFRLMNRDNFPRFIQNFEAAENERTHRGGGSPFAVRLIREGVEVGTLVGQALLSSLDALTDRDERLRILDRVLARRQSHKQLLLQRTRALLDDNEEHMLSHETSMINLNMKSSQVQNSITTIPEESRNMRSYSVLDGADDLDVESDEEDAIMASVLMTRRTRSGDNSAPASGRATPISGNPAGDSLDTTDSGETNETTTQVPRPMSREAWQESICNLYTLYTAGNDKSSITLEDKQKLQELIQLGIKFGHTEPTNESYAKLLEIMQQSYLNDEK